MSQNAIDQDLLLFYREHYGFSKMIYENVKTKTTTTATTKLHNKHIYVMGDRHFEVLLSFIWYIL